MFSKPSLFVHVTFIYLLFPSTFTKNIDQKRIPKTFTKNTNKCLLPNNLKTYT